MRGPRLALAAALVALAVPAVAQPGGVDNQAYLSADEVVWDKALDTIAAKGNVEIAHMTRVLRADSVSYNQRADRVVASGNVSVVEATGDVVFAEYVELDLELRNGFVSGVKALLADRSRLAAVEGRRVDGNRFVLKRGVFSPCAPCADNPDRPLKWQVKALTVVHDEAEKIIEYKDAWLEVFGVPVAYVPYLYHPDPSVHRKTGLLPPSYGHSSNLGYKLEVPVFVELGPDRDMTVTPLMTTKEGPVVKGEYRQVWTNGLLDAKASLTQADERDQYNQRLPGQEMRGHVALRGTGDVAPYTRAGLQIERSTDDTYLKKYELGSQNTLISRAYLENFRGRDYAAVQTYAFQGLRKDDEPGQSPWVFPMVDWAHIGEPNRHGARTEVDMSAVALTRLDGRDSRRATAVGKWVLPYTASTGDVHTLTASLRGDAYSVVGGDPPRGTARREEDATTGRLVPELVYDWRMPFVRPEGTVRQMFEPIGQLVTSPNGANGRRIPNEDSLSFEFDDTSVFSPNRFPGYDRIEGGTRANYGVKGSVYGMSGGYSSLLVGQSYRFHADESFGPRSGLDSNRSDVVSGLRIVPSDYLQYFHRIRIAHEDGDIRRNESYLTIGPKELRVTLGYAALDREAPSIGLDAREEFFANVSARIGDAWRITAQTRQDLEHDTAIKNGLAVIYQDECTTLSWSLMRDYTRDRDVQPSTSLVFRIRLRNLG
ncbi:MAG: LPS-assembly protein LptD [Alphaproteobacteria bacterium]|nr:LPS-assembly protein LptD [Alphaproteobacteria bacterium]